MLLVVLFFLFNCKGNSKFWEFCYVIEWEVFGFIIYIYCVFCCVNIWIEVVREVFFCGVVFGCKGWWEVKFGERYVIGVSVIDLISINCIIFDGVIDGKSL